MKKPYHWTTLLRRSFVWLTHLLILLTPFIFTWVNEELFEFNKMLFVYAATIVLAGIWIALRVLDQQWRWPRTYLTIPLIVFVISQVLSTVFSIHPYTSWFGYYTRFHGGLLSTFSYAAIYIMLATELRREDIKPLLMTFSLAAWGVALYSIPESFGHSPSCWLISGGRQFDASCWKQDVQSRIFGTFGQPNWLAAFALMALPITAALAALPHKVWLRISAGLVSISMLIVVFLTKSRSGYLALATMAGTSLLLIETRLWRSGAKLRAGIGLLLLIAASVAVLQTPWREKLQLQSIGCFLEPTTFFSSLKANTIPSNQPDENRLETGGTDSGIIRCIVWHGAWKIWQRYPLLGSGVETFAYSYYQDRPVEHNYVSEWDFLYNKAHNEFLNFLATTGLVGLFAYLWLIGAVVVQAVKLAINPHQQRDTTFLAAGIGLATIGLSVSNFFGFSTVSVTLLLFVLAAVLHLLSQTSSPVRLETTKNGTTSPHLERWQYLVLIVIGISSFWGVLTVWSWWRADHSLTQGKSYLAAGYTLEGLSLLEEAVKIRPNESTFTDELAATYAQVAVALYTQDQSTASAEFIDTAKQMSAYTVLLNTRHLNWYKSRASMLITLAQIDPALLSDAFETLHAAQKLAPTDPKIRYNLGLIYASQNATAAAQTEFQAALELRPNYIQAQEAMSDLTATASANKP